MDLTGAKRGPKLGEEGSLQKELHPTAHRDQGFSTQTVHTSALCWPQLGSATMYPDTMPLFVPAPLLPPPLAQASELCTHISAVGSWHSWRTRGPPGAGLSWRTSLRERKEKHTFPVRRMPQVESSRPC